MKKTIVKVLLAVAAIAAPLASRADLIWYEGFNYTNGVANITNCSAGVWINFSGSGNHDMFVVTNQLQVSTTGNTVAGASRADDDRRPLPSPYNSNVQVLYASFTVICTNLPNGAGSYFASFYNPKSGTGGGYFGRIQAFTNGTVVPNTWRLGVTANTLSANPANGGYPVDLALNTPYQVVEELDPVTLDAATIWINPLDVYQTGSAPTETHYTSSDSIGAATTTPVTDYSFRQASSFGNGFWIITNLTLATTFAEAATNIWATNALPPIIVSQPTAVTTNFPTASISLAALAAGQGLGNLTYQWQKSDTPDNANPSDVSNANGNSNILLVPNAQTTDSGYYTMVATTPYGLSVTSAVAKVSIIDGAFPPQFTSQPVSQKVYSGQSVTFSTAVLGPPSGGTPVFTWYSNNVVVTVGQADNGYSSSYSFGSATTNLSANYKVAVTNAYGGIVSSNAALSVISPSQVTIAYLRTLVDRNNGYNPTNTPASIAYQVTGTVTTYTNLTTGNTSSYYLQDGTAGINIFVTGGSTFRPAQGDVVTFVGVLSGFTSGLELYADSADNSYPFTSYTDTGVTNALPAPISIGFDITTNLNYVNTNIAGSLVTLTDVYFGTNAGTVLPTAANYTGTVTNSSGKPFNLFFAYLDQDTAGQTLPTYAYSVTGVLYGINTNFSVAVTRFADIVTTPPPTPIPLGLAVSGGTLTFNWADPSFLLQVATNVAGPYSTIGGASSGFTTNAASAPTMFFRLYHQ